MRGVLAAALLITACSLPPAAAHATVLYVDNVTGRDTHTGSSPVAADDAGPLRTIARALDLAGPTDVIEIANTGVPYYESLTLSGARHGGTEITPFTIRGNGAVISGARPVPAAAWRNIDRNLWTFTPWRKGHYLLLMGDMPLPETACPREEEPNPAPGSWCAWRGRIWYHSETDVIAPAQDLWFAVEDVGLTLYAVRNVRIEGLTFRHFRLDGINAHDLAWGIHLDNVTLIGNARAGLAAGGSSRVLLTNSQISANREHSALITGQALVTIDESQLDVEPTVVNAPLPTPHRPVVARPNADSGGPFGEWVPVLFAPPQISARDSEGRSE